MAPLHEEEGEQEGEEVEQQEGEGEGLLPPNRDAWPDESRPESE